MASSPSGPDSDIECVFISEKVTVKVITQEVITVEDEGDSDKVATNHEFLHQELVTKDDSATKRPSTPLEGWAGSSPDKREEWELLFASGRKSANLPEFEESFGLLDPADVAICLDDNPDVTFVSENQPSSPQRTPSPRRLSLSDVICEDPREPHSSVKTFSSVEVAESSFTNSASDGPARTHKRRSNCLLTPKIQSRSRAEKNLDFAGGDPEELTGANNTPSRTNPSKHVKKARKPVPEILSSQISSYDNFNDKEAKLAQRDAKKLEKEQLAEKKKLEKHEKDKQRKVVRLQKEAEKLQKQALKEAYKPLQGGKRSLDYLRAHVPRTMLDAMGRAELQSIIEEESGNIKFVEVDVIGEAASVIRWTRALVTAALDSNDQFNKLSTMEEEIDEKDLLIQIPKKSLVSMVDFYKELQNGGHSADRESLHSFHHRWKSQNPEKSLHFFVYGMDKYFRNQLQNALYGDNRPAKAKPVRKSILEIPYNITHEDMEEAFLDFSCRSNHRIIMVETPKDFARLLVTFHKSISDATSKTMQRQESALFDAISANTKTHGVFVPEDQLDGYKELWIRQLEQFTLVSRDVAVTIASLYPSPRLLLKAYDDCATQRQKEQLVENVVVRRGTDRRVGPKMSKMLFNFICSLDGSEFLE